MGCYSFDDNIPRVHPKAFVHPEATLIGRVIIEEGCYVGAGAVLRGDIGLVHLEKESNVQENCVLHTFPNRVTKIGERAHIGHSAVIHGAEIGKNCLIGIASVVLDDSVVEENTIVGAFSLIPKKARISSGHLYYGIPVKRIRELAPNELEEKKAGTALYVDLASNKGLEMCEPIIDENAGGYKFSKTHRTFKEIF